MKGRERVRERERALLDPGQPDRLLPFLVSTVGVLFGEGNELLVPVTIPLGRIGLNWIEGSDQPIHFCLFFSTFVFFCPPQANETRKRRLRRQCYTTTTRPSLPPYQLHKTGHPRCTRDHQSDWRAGPCPPRAMGAEKGLVRPQWTRDTPGSAACERVMSAARVRRNATMPSLPVAFVRR